MPAGHKPQPSLRVRLALLPRGSGLAAQQPASHAVAALRQTQAWLRRREARLAQTSRMAKVGSWSVNTSTNPVDWTEKTAQWFGVAAAALAAAVNAISRCPGDTQPACAAPCRPHCATVCRMA